MDRAVALRGLDPARIDRSRRRAERGLVAAYIHELSARHGARAERHARDHGRRERAVDPFEGG